MSAHGASSRRRPGPLLLAAAAVLSSAVAHSPNQAVTTLGVEADCGEACGALAEGGRVADRNGEPGPPHPLWVPRWDLAMGPEVPLCAFLLFVSGIFCAAAGVGGGGVFVAVLMVAGKLTPHDAIPMSKAIVFFGAIASLGVNLSKGTIGSHGSSIDLEVCKLVVPSALLGTFIGVPLNWHIPDLYITTTLALVLVGITAMVLRVAVVQCREEASAPDGPPIELSAPEAPPSSVASKQALGGCDYALGFALLVVVITFGTVRYHVRACAEDLRSGGSFEGACAHPVMTTMFGRGRTQAWLMDPATSGVLFALVDAVPLVSCVALSVLGARDVVSVSPVRAVAMRRVVSFQVMALVAGVLAGLVGIGGGLIFSPFFVVVGMDPSIAVGTSSSCVLFTSSSTTMQYAFTDRIVPSLSLIYGSVVLAASSTGTVLVHRLRERFPLRKSFITFIVAGSLALSAVLVLAKLATLVQASASPAAAAAAAVGTPPVDEGAASALQAARRPRSRAIVRRG